MAVPIADGGDLDALDIPTVCRRTRFGRSYIYEQIRSGALRARKYGRLTRILRLDYEAWLAAAPAIAPAIGNDPAPRTAPLSGRHARPEAAR
jgi:excisionase family DNA binding protein